MNAPPRPESRRASGRVELMMFDLDGTLVDTAPEIAATVNEVLTSTGLAPLPADQIRNWIGFGARATMRSALLSMPAIGTSTEDLECRLDALMERFAVVHGQHCGTTGTPYPGVAATLRALCERDIRLAVVTNKEARFTEQVLTRHDLAQFFDPIVSGDTLDERKPSAQPIRYCLSRHGVDAPHAVLVGDSSVDARAARNAGVAFWAVPYGYNGGAPIAAAQPDRLLNDFAELLIQPGIGQPCGAPVPAPT